jgi:secreted PhoX family phosphatase
VDAEGALQRPVPVELDRRTFLQLAGLGAGAAMAGVPLAGCAAPSAPRLGWVGPDGSPTWTPVRLPIPAWGDGGTAGDDAQRLASFAVRDELVVPEGFRCEVLARWGDPLGASGARFGFSADFTALQPVAGRPGEFWLLVNHEYISSRPWAQGYEAATGRALPRLCVAQAEGAGAKPELELDGVRLGAGAIDLGDPRSAELHGERAIADLRALCRAALDDLGVSVLHVRRRADGGFERVPGSREDKRISGAHPSTPTFGNCSGGTTPWGTFLTGEENYQDQVRDEVDCRGRLVEAAPQRFGYAGRKEGIGEPQELRQIGQGLGLDGRAFGWVCEVDPLRGTLRKLTRLGRYRHENAAVRCVAGEPLAVYLGDDRRGGHVWKYVSRAALRDPRDPANSGLFDDGVLHAARFEPDGSGTWVPLEPSTPLARPRPELTAGGHQWLPDRRGGAAGTRIPAGGRVAVCADGARQPGLSADEWVASVELACGRPFAELTLGDLVGPPEDAGLAGVALEAWKRGVLLLEAFAMANAIGATPTARPEDLELHPTDGSVFVAFTDTAGNADGSPDRRVFPESVGSTSRRYGGILRLADEPASAEFRWSRFLSSGELWEEGGAFGCADNLAFDPEGNLWVACDLHGNAPVDRRPEGQGRVAGVFGNSALFMVPTRGPLAGRPVCFAVGPMESELTGPTFAPDGRALILSVQHPGEEHGTRGLAGGSFADAAELEISVATRSGELFTQRRSVPLGSNFPSGRLGDPPRPCVVVITRAT